jgi:hypothetical protein
VKARDLITRSLRLIGGLGETEALTANDAADALLTLNEWISALGTHRLTLFQIDRVVVPLVIGQASYTLGPGGDINRPRPQWIDGAGVVLDRAATEPTEESLLLLDDRTWRGVTAKGLDGTYPSAIYFDHAFTTTAGLARVHVHPVPTQGVSDLILYIPRAMAQFADLDTDYALPDGYARLLRLHLALELAPEWGLPVPKGLEDQAREALAQVKRANHRPPVAGMDPVLFPHGVGRFNLSTGT